MMRSRDPGVLFAKGSILDVLENHKQKALDEIRNLSANQVMEASDERLVEHFVEKFDIAPLVLYPDRAERQVEETTVETRDSFTYDIPRGGSLSLPGVKLSCRIPYSGDPGLWDITPSTYSLTAIRGELTRQGSDGIGYITVSTSQPQNQADASRMDAAIATQLASIQDMVSNQKTNIEQYRA